jgi:carbonic anhydrase
MNVANVVVHSDLNCLSVLQYAVDVLRVEHVIVCGHYGCGGVEVAWKQRPLGLIDNWLRHVQDVAERHQPLFTRAMSDAQATDRLAELNVLEQVANVCRTTIAVDAWHRGHPLTVHGWLYGLQDGLLRDLGMSVTHENPLAVVYGRALAPSLPDGPITHACRIENDLGTQHGDPHRRSRWTAPVDPAAFPEPSRSLRSWGCQLDRL